MSAADFSRMHSLFNVAFLNTPKVGAIVFITFFLQANAEAQLQALPLGHDGYVATSKLDFLLQGVLSAADLDVTVLEEAIVKAAKDHETRSGSRTSARGFALDDDVSNILAPFRGELFTSTASIAVTFGEYSELTWVVALETESPEDRVSEFFASLERIVGIATSREAQNSDPKNGPGRRSASVEVDVHALQHGLGSWSFQDGLVIWSSDRESNTKYRDRLAKSGTQLGSERSFQRAFSGVSDKTNQAPSVAFFFRSECLPKLAPLAMPVFSPILDAYIHEWGEIWQSASLSELRGFGGRFTVQDEGEGNRCVLAIDTNLVHTIPRQGVLHAIGSPMPLSLDMPIGSVELRRFSTFSIDGELMVTEGRKMADPPMASENKSGFGSSDVLEYFAQANITEDSLRSIAAASEFTYVIPDSGDDAATKSQVAVRFRDHDPIDVLDRLIGLQTKRFIDSSSDRATIMQEHSDYIVWSLPGDVIDQYEAKRMKRLENLQAYIDKLKLQVDAGDIDEDKLRRYQSQYDIANAYVPAYVDWLKTTEYLFCDDWFYLNPMPSSVVEAITTRRPRSAQIVQLERDVKEVNSAFGLSHLSGVIAYWFPREISAFPSEDGSTSEVSHSRESEFVASLRSSLGGQHQNNDWLGRFAGGRLVMTLSKHTDGFRISGMHFKSND